MGADIYLLWPGKTEKRCEEGEYIRTKYENPVFRTVLPQVTSYNEPIPIPAASMMEGLQVAINEGLLTTYWCWPPSWRKFVRLAARMEKKHGQVSVCVD